MYTLKELIKEGYISSYEKNGNGINLDINILIEGMTVGSLSFDSDQLNNVVTAINFLIMGQITKGVTHITGGTITAYRNGYEKGYGKGYDDGLYNATDKS